MTKQTAFEITENIWDCFMYMAENQESSDFQDLSWDDLVNNCSNDESPNWLKKLALNRFLFEKKYCWRKPIHNMEWLHGDHVMLYDLYGCKEHRFTITTSDMSGQNTPDYVSLFCPYCNAENMSDGKQIEYIEYMSGEIEDSEKWQATLKYSKWTKDWNRKENRKYKIKKFFELWQYKIKKFLRVV